MSNVIYINNKNDYLKKSLIQDSLSIKKAMLCIAKSPIHIAFVLNSKNKFLGTITDGDIRRGMLKNFKIESSLKKILKKNSVSANEQTPLNDIISIMYQKNLKQIPILNKKKIIVGAYFYKELVEASIFQNLILIMAGGEGKRMRPLTISTPKPMIIVKDKPIIRHVIDNAKFFGFFNFMVSVKYKAQQIKKYLKDGKHININLKYLDEKIPLGTIGCLGLIHKKIREPFIVINGDVITKINLSELINFHISSKSFVTTAVKNYTFENPFGVVDISSNRIIKIEEKPKYYSNVLAGIYVFDPSVIKYVKHNQTLDIPMLLTKLIKNKKKVSAFPIHEEIHEFGNIKDLKKFK